MLIFDLYQPILLMMPHIKKNIFLYYQKVLEGLIILKNGTSMQKPFLNKSLKTPVK